MKPFIHLLVLMALGTTAHADRLYKWVDENGRTHYSDSPPASSKAKDITSELEPVNQLESAPSTKALSNVFPKESVAERQYRQQKAQQEQRQQAANQQRCARAKRDLNILKGRVYFADEQGRSYTITEKERERRAQQLTDLIRRECG